MSRTYYSEIHLHMTWHVKAGHRLLTPEIEPIAHDALRQKALETRGVIVHAIDGTETHVHLAVTIPPTVLISDFIGQLKGASSFVLNRTLAGSDAFAWQPGYGVLSFGTRALKWVVEYIANQKTHHAQNTTYARLEQTTADELEPSST
jgi:putative transposase